MLDLDKEDEGLSRRFTDEETEEVLNSIYTEIEKDGRRLIYDHTYQEGDFIISDNLAVGHEASPETQLSREKVGLRVMHRVTIQGDTPPSK